MNTQYEDLLQKVLSEGDIKGDRTGTGTTSIFGAQLRYDLSEGFPLITTKKVHTRSIIGELLWFLAGDTKNSNLSDQGIRIWNEWMNSDGTIGPGYSAQWRAWYSPSKEIIEIGPKEDSFKDYPNSIEITTEYLSSVRKDMESAPVARKRVFNLWENIIENILEFDELNVSPIWSDFSMFEKTINLVPGYHEWVKSSDMKLSIDYYQSNIYSPSTSIFLPEEYNTHQGNNYVYEYDGRKFFNISGVLEYVSKDNPINDSAAAHDDWGTVGEFNGIKETDVKKIFPKQGMFFRQKFVTDQVQQVIDTIKTNPDSRRIILSAWNAGEIDNMALAPCHALVQFYVVNGKLSCQLYQRSADLFLGVPFNIASYALLTHMIAQQCDLDVGDFIWTGGDCHIYDNLVDQVKEQVSRKAYEFPTLKLKKAKDIFSYSIDDVTIEGYVSHPAIKGKVAV